MRYRQPRLTSAEIQIEANSVFFQSHHTKENPTRFREQNSGQVILWYSHSLLFHLCDSYMSDFLRWSTTPVSVDCIFCRLLFFDTLIDPWIFSFVFFHSYRYIFPTISSSIWDFLLKIKRCRPVYQNPEHHVPESVNKEDTTPRLPNRTQRMPINPLNRITVLLLPPLLPLHHRALSPRPPADQRPPYLLDLCAK